MNFNQLTKEQKKAIYSNYGSCRKFRWNRRVSSDDRKHKKKKNLMLY